MSDPLHQAALAPILPAQPLAEYLAHQQAIDEAIGRVLASGRYILGCEVEAFEAEFAHYLGAGHAIGVGSATEALHLALRVLEVGPGDTVFTVSHTAVATVAAIELAGAIPWFVDIDSDSYTLDPCLLEGEILSALAAGARVKAVIPVHLYGHPADMPSILQVARRYGLAVIEDCAQSHGAICDGKMTGTWGDLAAFSFYPTKNLCAIGDGGALVTQQPDLAEKARRVRQYGWSKRYISDLPGMNTRLDEIQASILRVKLRTLDHSNQRRREWAMLYDDLLAATPLIRPRLIGAGTHVFHQYVVRSPSRDALQAELQQNGVSALIHYPVPIHLQPAYQNRSAGRPNLPVTERAAREVLSLPLHPGSTRPEIERTAEIITHWHFNDSLPS